MLCNVCPMVITVIEDGIEGVILGTAMVVGHGTVIVGAPTEDTRGFTNGIW